MAVGELAISDIEVSMQVMFMSELINFFAGLSGYQGGHKVTICFCFDFYQLVQTFRGRREMSVLLMQTLTVLYALLANVSELVYCP